MGNINMASYMANRRAQRRAKLMELLGGRCNKCGSTEDLQFDHIIPGTRTYVLSGCHLDKAWESILEEARKCQILCKSCHRQKSIQHGETGGGWNRNTKPQHGTAYMYTVHRCRCQPCRYAKKLYRAKETSFSQQVIPS